MGYPPSRRPGEFLPADKALVLGPKTTAELVFKTQIVFKPRALRVPHKVAHSLLVTDITLGSRCCLATFGEMPCDAFCEKRRAKLLYEYDWPTLSIGQHATVRVYNPTEKEMLVSGFFFGESVYR